MLGGNESRQPSAGQSPDGAGEAGFDAAWRERAAGAGGAAGPGGAGGARRLRVDETAPAHYVTRVERPPPPQDLDEES